MKITTENASYSLVTFVTHKRFAFLFFLPSCWRKLSNDDNDDSDDNNDRDDDDDDDDDDDSGDDDPPNP